MQVQIEFIVGGANSMIGGFCAGDVARVSAEMAKHLVEEVGIAKYITAQPAEPAKTATKARRAAPENK